MLRAAVLAGACAGLASAGGAAPADAAARPSSLRTASSRETHEMKKEERPPQHENNEDKAHRYREQEHDHHHHSSGSLKDFKRIDPQDLGEGISAPYTSQAELDSQYDLLKKVHVKNPRTIRDVPPVPTDGGPLAVGVRIELVKFQDLDEVAGTVNLVLDLVLCWADERLSHQPSQASSSPGKVYEMLPVTSNSNSIWTPDIVIMNQVAELENMFATENSPIIIADDAFRQRFRYNVIWQRRINLESRCTIDMSHFPFDRQSCEILIGSWASAQRQMMLCPLDSRQKFDQDVHTSEFQVLNISVNQSIVTEKDTKEKFSEVKYDLVLQRYPHYWMVNYMLPMFGVTMLSIATMWMSNAGTRMNSATRLLLCIVQIMNITTSWRPANETDIWLDRFQTHCLALSIASVMQSCIVDYIKNSGLLDLRWAPRDHTVDTLIRTTICFLAICVFVSDLCDLQERGGNDMVALYGSFHGHSTKLLVGLIYMIFLCLGTSSVFSTLWLVLPAEWWKSMGCRGCTQIASGAEKTASTPSKFCDKRASSPV